MMVNAWVCDIRIGKGELKQIEIADQPEIIIPDWKDEYSKALTNQEKIDVVARKMGLL